MAKLSVWSLGSDPEFFMSKEGKPLPAFGLIGGAKKAPLPFYQFLNPGKLDDVVRAQMKASPEKFSWYLEDGAALELNIPVANSFSSLVSNLRTYKLAAQEHVANKLGAQLLDSSCITLSKADLDNPLAKVSGCDPDFDAYQDGNARSAFKVEQFGDKRFAGFHIHVGMKPWPKQLPKHIFVQFMDLFLGSMILPKDEQAERRPFYGQPGLYRPTSYGVEYRSLSAAAYDLFCNDWKRISHMMGQFLQYLATANAPHRVDAVMESLEEVYFNKVPWPLVKSLLGKGKLTSAESNALGNIVFEAAPFVGVQPNYG